ncbi:MAG: phage tail tube protein [Hyphomonas sp.]|nr:phage tail tube protein [Hyphomonas sp.]
MSTLPGKKLVMSGAFQDDFETPADEGVIQLPYYDESFQAGEGLEADDEIRPDVHNERDMTAPAPTLPNPSGSMTVAMDINAMAFWLKLLLGAPVTTGAADPWTHAFASGKPELPSATLEIPMGEDRWKAMIGAKLNTFGFSFDKEAGYKRAQLGFSAREVRQITGEDAALFNGLSPTVWPRAKAPGTLATFAIGGVTVGRCMGGGFQYTNNLTPENFADGSRFPSDYFPGAGSAELTPRIRLDRSAAANAVLDNFAGSEGAPFACSVTLPLAAGRSLVLAMGNCHGEKISPVIGGPGPVEFQGRIVASQTSVAPALTATLINGVAAV